MEANFDTQCTSACGNDYDWPREKEINCEPRRSEPASAAVPAAAAEEKHDHDDYDERRSVHIGTLVGLRRYEPAAGSLVPAFSLDPKI
jgi:hypothetical protein